MIEKALEMYAFVNPAVTFIRHNENMTYRVDDGNGRYLLRIHRPVEGFHVDFLRMGRAHADLVRGEMELLSSLCACGDIRIQKPFENRTGEALTMIDGTPVTVLEWVEGETLDRMGITDSIAHALGETIGRLHCACAGIAAAGRYIYGADLLENMIAEAGAARESGHFGDRHTSMIIAALEHIRHYLRANTHRFIINHSDLGKSNLVIHEGEVVPIDFSLSGWCVPEMDLASVFSHLHDDRLNRAVLDGYISVRGTPPDTSGLDACFSLQILLFLISQHSKIAGEPWLPGKLDEWCEKQFVPLTEGKKPYPDIDLYT